MPHHFCFCCIHSYLHKLFLQQILLWIGFLCTKWRKSCESPSIGLENRNPVHAMFSSNTSLTYYTYLSSWMHPFAHKNFQPGPGLGEYRVKHEIFDNVFNNLLRQGQKNDTINAKQVLTRKLVLAASTDAVRLEPQNAVPDEPQCVSAQPDPQQTPPHPVANQHFPGPVQLASPIQVLFESREPSVSPNSNTNRFLPLTRTETGNINTSNRQSRIPIESGSAQSTPSASPRFRFDQYDYHRGVPSRPDKT